MRKELTRWEWIIWNSVTLLSLIYRIMNAYFSSIDRRIFTYVRHLIKLKNFQIIVITPPVDLRGIPFSLLKCFASESPAVVLFALLRPAWVIIGEGLGKVWTGYQFIRAWSKASIEGLSWGQLLIISSTMPLTGSGNLIVYSLMIGGLNVFYTPNFCKVLYYLEFYVG